MTRPSLENFTSFLVYWIFVYHQISLSLKIHIHFKTVDCKYAGDGGTLNVQIEQQDRKLRTFVKQIKSIENKSNATSSAAIGVGSGEIDTGLVYEISFTPEIETKCVVDLEYLDIAEGVICGDSVVINVKAKDFRITPFPLQPFAINSKSTFNVEILMSNAGGGVVDLSRLQLKIKTKSK